MSLNTADFHYVRTLVHKASAIVLEDEKLYLAESRLQTLARRAAALGVPPSMEITHDLIRQLVETIWSSILELEVQLRDRFTLPPGNEGFLTGCIQTTGAWEGAVTVNCSSDLVRAAAILFDTPAGDLTHEQVHDALGELTNMVGET